MSDVPELAKNKYLIPNDHTVGQFMHSIRSRLTIPAEKALLFLFSNKYLPPAAALMTEIDKKYRDDDGFLYVTYSASLLSGT